MNDCCDLCMPEPPDPRYTHGEDWSMDSNRPRLQDDERLKQKTSNKPLETGLVVRQPL